MSSALASRTSGGTSNILPQERTRASFTPRDLTEMFWGGKEALAHREAWLQTFETNTLFNTDNDMFLTRSEYFRLYLKRFFATYKIVKENKELLAAHSPVHGEGKHSVGSLSETYGGFTDHFALFLQTILMQASPSQQKEWLRRAMNLEIIGTYAQTELGHGSNVRGLETIAVYDEPSESFIVDSPTLTSMKWWPGALGLLATHAIVYARLLIGGKDHGYHAFMVQLRDENHEPLPGVEVGDIGPKLGFKAVDSGYCAFHKVRIPRTNMLCKFQQVEKGGKYVAAPSGMDKIAYMTMTKSRVIIAKGCGFHLAKAVTIAVRYNAVRSQGFISSKQGIAGGEQRLLDYVIQQVRLFPNLALSHAIMFSSGQLQKLMDTVEAAMSAKSGVAVDPDVLTSLHVTSAAMKAFCTVMSCEGMEEVRRCCGGQGYTLSSGIATLLMEHMPSITYEGDLIPMALQVARFLVGTFAGWKRNGKKPKDTKGHLAGYIFESPNVQVPKDAKGLRDIPTLLSVWRSIAYRSVYNAAMALNAANSKIPKGSTETTAWNECQIVLVRSAHIHAVYTLINGFATSITTIANPSLRKVEERLLCLFALSKLDNFGVAETCMTQPQAIAVRNAIYTLLAEIRPDAVSLVDAFGFTDRQLKSCIGREDGNVYEAVVDWARRSPLNHDIAVRSEIKASLDKVLDKEYLKTQKSKL